MEKNESNPVPVFFIVGRARSGTTLLRTILDNHPAVLIPQECAFVTGLYSKYHSKKRWTKKCLDNFYIDLIHQPSFGYLNINASELRQKILSTSESTSYANLCKLVWSSYIPLTQKEKIQLLGDKNIHYALHVKKLKKIFPDARFIHLVRDPRGNIQSLLEVDFESHILSSLAWRWKYYNCKIEKEKKKSPESFLTLRYEDFVSAPESETRKICSFLGIEYYPFLLDFYNNKDDVIKTFPVAALEKYHLSLFHPVNESRKELWKEKLTSRQIKIVEAVCGKYAQQFGYETINKGSLSLYYFLVVPGILYGQLYMVWGIILDSLPFSLRMWIIRVMGKIFKPWWTRYEKK
jgi:hypothetical protein